MRIRSIAKKIISKSPSLYSSIHSQNFERTHKQDFSKAKDKEKFLLLEIQQNGFTVIPEFFDTDFCNSCIKDLDWMFENKKEFVHTQSDLRIFGAEDLSENIFKFGNNELFNNLANIYNSTPTSNAFTLANKIFDSNEEFGSGGSWHRDSIFRQFKAIVYLNDVDENNGPFEVIMNSHTPKQIKKDEKSANYESMQSRFNAEEVNTLVKQNPERLKTLTGKAGTVILVDTSVIHRGIPLKQGTRYALTNYYFENSQINSHLIEHFSPIVSPEKVLQMGLN
jgi:hypothetical protein